MNQNIKDKLDAVYAQIPGIACKGLCQASCHAAPAIQVEYDRLKARMGYALPIVGQIPGFVEQGVQVETSLILGEGSGVCPMLNRRGLCRVYDERPLICRVWGVADDLKCPHGCEPVATLTEEDSLRLIKLVMEISREATQGDL